MCKVTAEWTIDRRSVADATVAATRLPNGLANLLIVSKAAETTEITGCVKHSGCVVFCTKAAGHVQNEQSTVGASQAELFGQRDRPVGSQIFFSHHQQKLLKSLGSFASELPQTNDRPLERRRWNCFGNAIAQRARMSSFRITIRNY